MSATLNIEVVPMAEDTKPKDARVSYAKSIKAALLDEKRAAITAGCYLALAKATFTADEMDDWKSWSVEVTRKSYKTVESYLAVGKAYASSSKTLQGRIKDWTFEALQAYASVPVDDRPNVVTAVLAEDSNPSPELVRTARDIAKDEKLTDAERNEKDAAKRKRDKQRNEDKTVEMVKTLAPVLNRFKDNAQFDAFLIGVEMGIAHKDAKLIGQAVKQYRKQREGAVERVTKAAEKLAAGKTAEKAAA